MQRKILEQMRMGKQTWIVNLSTKIGIVTDIQVVVISEKDVAIQMPITG